MMSDGAVPLNTSVERRFAPGTDVVLDGEIGKVVRRRGNEYAVDMPSGRRFVMAHELKEA